MGVVYQLTPQPNGSWTENILHSFGISDGAYAWGGIAIDSSGNLYGTTQAGAASSAGLVFELKPASDGNWTENILHEFSGSDGNSPYAGVVFDRSGNLYGTTFSGGAYNAGTIFEVHP